MIDLICIRKILHLERMISISGTLLGDSWSENEPRVGFLHENEPTMRNSRIMADSQFQM